MTRNFVPAPFSITKEQVARITVEGFTSQKIIIYAPKKLKILMSILRIIPRSIFDKL